MITLYWAPQTRATRLFWALEEAGVEYELAPVDIRNPDAVHPKGFLAASPLRKVPAIRDGEVGVADSAAIALYLADRYQPGVLAPTPDDPLRGDFLTWLFFTPSAIEPAMIEKVADLPPRPLSYPWGSFERVTGAIETRLDGREWLVGEGFTMADLMVGGAISFLEVFGLFVPTPRMADYVARCRARPAVARAMEREAAAEAALR